MTGDLWRTTIMGCGSSGGSPRLGGPDGRGNWGLCDPAEPRNRRRRCALMVERIGAAGRTRLLIDMGQDLRVQLLDAGVGELDAAAVTHPHADHIHGLDDLRAAALNMKRRIPLWADAPTQEVLLRSFHYCFTTPPGSSYPPIFELRAMAGAARIEGAGGDIDLRSFRVGHGAIEALGYRFGDVAYTPDVNRIPEEAWEALAGTRVWIVDCLQRRPHGSHAHLDMTLGWIERLKPERAILTNLNVDLDYRALLAELPPGIAPAYDGMTVELPAAPGGGIRISS
ncbi:MBL fold metallo-hydrolase [Neomegalonema sp.]|uniref:MBL fold metallo-hydrolase n=1 Tax=Neomegalonema sp. TaxID=2039713 RepID=UPI00261C3425|nr:MBL fold metallo-hydrolase [Neomegalonema sp.]MDD2869861.1 MBL fold metallo-hydrolase [Neomegalonema sp.]